MRIVYKDGSILTVARIEVYEKELYCDDVYIVDIPDVDHIEEDE